MHRLLLYVGVCHHLLREKKNNIWTMSLNELILPSVILFELTSDYDQCAFSVIDWANVHCM